MSNLVINQHTVPQSYLRFFANSKEQVFVYDKTNDKKYPSNVRNVASERFFYDFPEDFKPSKHGFDLEDQFVEKQLSQIEGVLPRLIKKIQASYAMGNPLFLTNDDRSMMAFLMAVQIYRTRSFRNYVLEVNNLLLNTLVKDMVKNENPELPVDDFTIGLNEEMLSVEHATYLMDNDKLEELASVLLKHIWVVGVNETSVPMYTSDNPIVKIGNVKDNFMKHDGYASKGIEIHYPISNKFILMLMDRQYFYDYSSLDGTFVPLTKEKSIHDQNHLQVAQCSRQVFCMQDSLELARDICTKYPEIIKGRQMEVIYKGKKHTIESIFEEKK